MPGRKSSFLGEPIGMCVCLCAKRPRPEGIVADDSRGGSVRVGCSNALPLEPPYRDDVSVAKAYAATHLPASLDVPVFGLATAASILVGQQLGRNEPDLAARGTWTTMWLAGGYMMVVSALYVVVPDLFLYGFFAGDTTANGHDIRAIAVVLLRYVAAYNLFDALNLVFVNAIKGAGDTRFVFGVSLAMAMLLGAGTWIGMSVFHAGLHGCWTFVTLWVWLLGLIYMARFLHGRWRSMRVIEMQPLVSTP